MFFLSDKFSALKLNEQIIINILLYYKIDSKKKKKKKNSWVYITCAEEIYDRLNNITRHPDVTSWSRSCRDLSCNHADYINYDPIARKEYTLTLCLDELRRRKKNENATTKWNKQNDKK